MLDIQYIRENKTLVEEKSAQKGYLVNINKLLDVDQKRRGLQGKIDELRQQRNLLAGFIKGKKLNLTLLFMLEMKSEIYKHLNK